MPIKLPKFALAALAASAMATAPLAANAQDYHHDNGGYHNDYRGGGGDYNRGYDRGHGDYDRGRGGGIGAGGILLGLGIGALVGGAIVASQQPRYAPPPPVYYAPPPPAYYAPPPGDYSPY
jgi:hypothetical protein